MRTITYENMKNPCKYFLLLFTILHVLILKLYCYRLFTFEKAYCLYRLNRPEESLQLINEESGQNFKELKAQILYKLER